MGLIDSENSVRAVLNRIGKAEEQLDDIENWLSDYNTQLMAKYLIINIIILY
jgi:hypothetical protein